MYQQWISFSLPHSLSQSVSRWIYRNNCVQVDNNKTYKKNIQSFWQLYDTFSEKRDSTTWGKVKGTESKQSLQSEKLCVQQFVNNGKESHLSKTKACVFFLGFERKKGRIKKNTGTKGSMFYVCKRRLRWCHTSFFALHIPTFLVWDSSYGCTFGFDFSFSFFGHLISTWVLSRNTVPCGKDGSKIVLSIPLARCGIIPPVWRTYTKLELGRFVVTGTPIQLQMIVSMRNVKTFTRKRQISKYKSRKWNQMTRIQKAKFRLPIYCQIRKQQNCFLMVRDWSVKLCGRGQEKKKCFFQIATPKIEIHVTEKNQSK